MLSIVDIVLVVILTLCLGLYLWWKIEKTIYYRALRLKVEAGKNSTEHSICRYGVNEEGEITRVRVRAPQEGN